MSHSSNPTPATLTIVSLFCSATMLLAADKISNNGLVSYFPMNDNVHDTSSAVTPSTSANHASWTGTAVYQEGLLGRAATVGNGSGSNYLTTTASEYVFGTGSFTILYWTNIKASVSSDPVLIAGGGKNWSSSGGTLGWVSTIAGDDIKANISDGTARKDTAWIDLDHDAYFNDNRIHWTLVALVVDRDTQSLTSYVLDDQVTTIGDDTSAPSTLSISDVGNLTGSNQNIIIGQDGDGAGYGTSYPGLPASGIDDLSIWNRPLSQDEIQIIYTAGRNNTPLGDILTDLMLEIDLDQDTEQATLTWFPYDTTGLTSPQLQISRDGAVIATVPATDTSYIDSPPAPAASSVTYLYKIELLDSGTPVADSAAEGSVTWFSSATANGLIANYRFEDGFQDTASAANAHDGAAVNATAITGNGLYGHCIELKDQLKQGVHIPSHADLNFGSDTDFTVSLWFKRWGVMTSGIPNGEAGDGVLICKQNWSNGSSSGWGIYATSDGGVKWNIAGSSRKSGDIINGSSAIANGFWHHVLISCTRSGKARCYIDGRFVKEIDIAGAGSVDNALPLAIGIDSNGNYSWKGHIDEVALWNRALNDIEAKDVFQTSGKGLALSGKSIVDSDDDGMADTWEITHFGNLDQSASGDFDNDGKSNFKEYAEGENPNSGAVAAATRVTSEEVNGQTYPVLHYIRPELDGDVSYLPEASADLATWSSGNGKFLPFGNPTDLENGQREYHVRYYQSIDAVAEGRIMFRIRMESRYQAAISQTIEPTVELRNGQAIVSWTTSEPTVTVINYGTDGTATTRYEDYTLSTYHEVVINIAPGKSFTYTVIQTDENGAETRSNTFTVSSLWDYSPPPVPDQFGFDSTSNEIDWSARADEILTLPGVIDRGYCLDYLCGDGRLAYELARKSQIVIIGVEDTQAEVDAARAFLMARGVYGSRVSVMLASDLANLPFPKDFFNLIISQSQVNSASSYSTLKAAVEKHTIPNRGIIAGIVSSNMHADAAKPTNPGTGSWSMAYGNPSNTSSSTEEFNGKKTMADFELRWLGAPGPELAWDRQTAEQPPLAVNGRFYCQGKDRILALDSHNGSVLWTKELKDAQRFNLLRDAGNLTADDDAVWLSLRKECWKMDGDTGHRTVFPLIDGPRADLDYVWNYICSTGNHLLGSASVDEAFYKNHWGGQYWYTNTTGSLANQIVSDNLFSLDQSTGALNWEYSDGLILSVSITVGNGKIFFLETRNPSATAGTSRRLSTAIWKTNLYLVCLDLETGSQLWEKPSSFNGGNCTAFLMYDSQSDKVILSAGNGATNYLYAFNPANGSPVWNTSAGVYKSDHGGKNQHPVISNGEILFTPNVYDANTGTLKRNNIPTNGGQGCNTYWGSKNLLFFRTGYSGNGLSMWPTDGSASKSGIDQIKGACWLNWAPADGMFLIQEKSAGCSCGAWVHISLGWGPKE